MATGLGFGFGLTNTWRASDEDLEDNNLVNLQAHLPLYLSVHPTEKLSFYCNPQFIYQRLGPDVIYDFDEMSSNNFLYGGSLGAMYGKKTKLVLEASFFQYQVEALEFPVMLPQIGLGATFEL